MSEKNLSELMDNIISNNTTAENSAKQSQTVPGDDISASAASELTANAPIIPDIKADCDTPQKLKANSGTIKSFLLKTLTTAGVGYVCYYIGMVIFIITSILNINPVISFLCALIPPVIFIPLIWVKKPGKTLIVCNIFSAAVVLAFGINLGINIYNEYITIDTSPNIDVSEYQPFDEDSKIVTLGREASLKLEGDLPIVDGAAAVFPVYSAFVNETYPDTVELYDGVFEYNNTVGGYNRLAEKQTDIFFGAYPSGHQLEYAAQNSTNFVFTPIGIEAFVFFVHKDNPIDNLTTEQIQQIYAGEITNWAELGGKNEPIAAYQRNEGSGSQSMLIRFMDGKEIMEPPTEMVNDLMSGIIEQVADYHSKSGSIGFSFRYYVEGIIKNPDIKLLSVDGVAPTVENIKNGSYPITTPLYAVTYEGNDNENVDKLLEWVLSDEGQEIIEKTGYAGVAK